MLSIAITISLIIGFLLGFIAYHATRVGYKLLIEALEEGKSIKKEPLAYTPTKVS